MGRADWLWFYLIRFWRCSFMPVAPSGRLTGLQWVPAAQAQSALQNLVRKLRGETLPAGIYKSNGRLEATQVDVSSKYAGRLTEVDVEEGSTVSQGQVARQDRLRPRSTLSCAPRKADVQRAKDALAAAESEISTRQSALDFAKSDFERGAELVKTSIITRQTYEQRKRNYEAADLGGRSRSPRSVIRRSLAIKSCGGPGRSIQSMLADLTLVSPRNGRVQYQLARAGEVVGAGTPILTILDLTDVYMTLFLPAPMPASSRSAARRACPRPGPALRRSGDGQFRRRRRAVHAQDRRDQGRAHEADVPRQAEDRSAGPAELLQAGEDRRTRARLSCASSASDGLARDDLQVKLPAQ